MALDPARGSLPEVGLDQLVTQIELVFGGEIPIASARATRRLDDAPLLVPSQRSRRVLPGHRRRVNVDRAGDDFPDASDRAHGLVVVDTQICRFAAAPVRRAVVER